MARLAIDPDDPAPPSAQIVRSVRRQVRDGLLEPGDRLPAIRALAEELGLAPGTVARAYKELEEEGAVVTRRGAGTRVAEGDGSGERARSAPAPGARSGLDPELRAVLAPAVDAARDLGHPDAAIAAAVRELLRTRPD